MGERLLATLLDPNTHPITRQATASYIASFCARGVFVPLRAVMACLDLMVPWLHRYADTHEAEAVVTAPNVEAHGVFYMVCQAVFYMFAFRHRELLGSEEGLRQVRLLKLDRLVTSPLNPLKVCLDSVVEEFSKCMRHHQLLYCYTIIQRNKRIVLSTRGVHGGADCLDSFFPFDPYLLSKSAAAITPIYQVYTPGEYDDEEEAMSGDEEEWEDDTSMGTGSVAATPEDHAEFLMHHLSLQNHRRRHESTSSAGSPHSRGFYGRRH
eukprot:Colp12_sorted_trinity150504_noHs@25152